MTTAPTRVSKPAEARAQEILEAARRLFTQKGYEATTVQDLIDAVGIAKGTFYHHFRSKSEVLDGVIETLVQEVTRLMQAVVEDPQADALTKFHRIFTQANAWKLQHRDLMLELLRVLYRPENAALRERLRRASVQAGAPFLGAVIRQGVAEGVFQVEDPEETAAILLHMGQALGETLAEVLLAGLPQEAVARQVARKAKAYEAGLERVLGAQPGSIRLGLAEMLRQWAE